jgi:hypothetical protein
VHQLLQPSTSSAHQEIQLKLPPCVKQVWQHGSRAPAARLLTARRVQCCSSLAGNIPWLAGVQHNRDANNSTTLPQQQYDAIFVLAGGLPPAATCPLRSRCPSQRQAQLSHPSGVCSVFYSMQHLLDVCVPPCLPPPCLPLPPAPVPQEGCSQTGRALNGSHAAAMWLMASTCCSSGGRQWCY